MDMANQALARIAPLMRDLIPSPLATVSYDVMSDSLIWSDEIPDIRILSKVEGWGILRFVLHYRTTGLILGDLSPEQFVGLTPEQYRDLWDEAGRLFPGWPGFAPERCSPDHRLAYYFLSAPSKRELDEIWRELDEQTQTTRSGEARREPVGPAVPFGRPWWRRLLRL